MALSSPLRPGCTRYLWQFVTSFILLNLKSRCPQNQVIVRRTLQLASNLGVSDPQLKPRLTHMPLTYVKAVKNSGALIFGWDVQTAVSSGTFSVIMSSNRQRCCPFPMSLSIQYRSQKLQMSNLLLNSCKFEHYITYSKAPDAKIYCSIRPHSQPFRAKFPCPTNADTPPSPPNSHRAHVTPSTFAHAPISSVLAANSFPPSQHYKRHIIRSTAKYSRTTQEAG